jgi:hypothetical protein
MRWSLFLAGIGKSDLAFARWYDEEPFSGHENFS